MIGISEVKKRILAALREEALDQFQIAAAIAEPPFRVRGELQDLRRERLVRNVIQGGRIVWALTVRGEHASFDQLQLGAER